MSTTIDTQFPEGIAPALAKWLAPYVAAELAHAQRPGSIPVPTKSSDYDAATCAEYVRELGVPVINRATDFFQKLDADGQIGSLELANVMGLPTPRNIPSNLTNSLKQRARKMGLQVPWTELVSEDSRTVWADRDGIAGRMVDALRAETQRRFGSTH